MLLTSSDDADHSRLWGLYIGRPPVINLSDVSISRPDPNGHSWDTKVLAAWVELLDLAGQISERLYVILSSMASTASDESLLTLPQKQ